MENIPPQGQYSFQGWEMLLGVFSRLLDVHPTIFAHTIFPFSLIILSYIAYFGLAKRILPQPQVTVFIILLCVFHLFGGYSDVSSGSLLLSRIWQGKSVLYLVIFPYTYALLKDYLENKSNLYFLGILILISITSFLLNPIAIYLIPMLVISVLLPECIRLKQFSSFLKALVIFIPLALFAFVIRDTLTNSFSFNNPDPELYLTSWQSFNYVVMGGGYYFVLYIGVIVFNILRKNDYLKSLLLYSPIILLIFVWNPIVSPYLARYVTSFATYWRVYWLLPTGIGICMVSCLILDRIKTQSYNLIVGVLISVLIILSGSWIIREKYLFSLPENAYKLPDSDVQVVKAILKYPNTRNAIILGPTALDQNLRQISPDLRLFWTRQHYMEDYFLSRGQKDEYQKRLALITMYDTKYRDTAVQFAEEISGQEIDLVIVPRKLHYLILDLDQFGAKRIITTKKYLVYKMNK